MFYLEMMEYLSLSVIIGVEWLIILIIHLIYHDHFSYFSIEVWNKFLKKYKMNIFDATVTLCSRWIFKIIYIKKQKNKNQKTIMTC